MKEYRCKKCRKLLFKYEKDLLHGIIGTIEIKCDKQHNGKKCKHMNLIKLEDL